MTVRAEPGRRSTLDAVHVHVDGAVWAECLPCDVYLELEDGAGLAAATETFAACHSSSDADHSRLLPLGWRSPLSRWCALSQ